MFPPMVVCGLKRRLGKDQKLEQTFVVCEFPFHTGVIPMKNPVLATIYEGPYAFMHGLDAAEIRRARHESEQVYQIVHGLRFVDGLNFLYVLPDGLIALGREELAKKSSVILQAMKKILTEVFGELDFIDAPECDIRLPAMRKELLNAMGAK